MYLKPFESVKKGVAIMSKSVMVLLLQEEIQGPGALLGYRTMWNRLCITRQLSISRFVYPCCHVIHYDNTSLVVVQEHSNDGTSCSRPK